MPNTSAAWSPSSFLSPSAEVKRTGQDSSLDAFLRAVASTDEAWVDSLPAPGQVVADKYRVEELLGRGGMGVVYRATHLTCGKQVAIKWMLRPSADAAARSRFLREARIAARVDHPHLVGIYDVGEDAGAALYLVMPLLRGETLRAHLVRGLPEPGQLIALMLPALRGVAALHASGIVHRDLKPENIFVCDGHAEQRAVVLDFGVSSVSRDTGQPALTSSGDAVGTPAYMSPEQLRDARKVDVRTDVYAAGVVLYEALTGRLPELEPRAPRSLRSAIPERLSRLLLRALAQRPEDRVPDMPALIAALERFAHDASEPKRAWRSRPARALSFGLLLVVSAEPSGQTSPPRPTSPPMAPVVRAFAPIPAVKTVASELAPLLAPDHALPHMAPEVRRRPRGAHAEEPPTHPLPARVPRAGAMRLEDF